MSLRFNCCDFHCFTTAFIPSGSGQRTLRHQYGELWEGRLDGSTGQCTGAIVSRLHLREPDGGRRGTCRTQDARRYCVMSSDHLMMSFILLLFFP